MHELIVLYGLVTIFICESMRGRVEKFGKKRHEGVTGGGEILPSRDLWMIPIKGPSINHVMVPSRYGTITFF